MISFIEAINLGHKEGLSANNKSYILGLGVNYPNGADGSTKELAHLYPDRVLDTPVSEASATGMCVGMATMGLNTIAHYGRIEFAMYAFDQIFTQAAKWDYMFGGNYNCKFSARINIGRQWGNGPQHTANYNSLLLNTPGLNIFWPSRPSEAYQFTYLLHNVLSPHISIEHRWLFKTKEEFKNLSNSHIATAKQYGKSKDNYIVTYGDGLLEALKIFDYEEFKENISIISLTAFIGEREINRKLISKLRNSKNIIFFETGTHQYGLLQAFLGQLFENTHLNSNIQFIAPPFSPVATSPKLNQEYYPTINNIIRVLNATFACRLKTKKLEFEDIHLAPEFDFSPFQPSETFFVD